jgi:hypothetical protein
MLAQAGRRSPPKPAPRYANQGRARTIYSDFPVSLLSLLGGVDRVMLRLSWCLTLFCQVVVERPQPLLRGKWGSRQMYDTKSLTKFSFGIGMENTKKIPTNTKPKY